MAEADYIAASNGDGEAVRSIVTTTRGIGSMDLITDSVLNWPNKFVATSGMLDTVTGLLDPDTISVFKGHLTGSIITIEQFAPGYSDVGHAINESVVLKPSTFWADTVAAAVGAGGVSSIVIKGTPIGLVNSSNTTYTTATPYIAGTLQVYINGLAQSNLVTETTPTTGVFTITPAPITGDDLKVYYHVANTAVGNADSLGGYQLTALLQAIYPIGSVFISGQSTMPSVVAGIGTWAALEGKVIVGKAAAGTFSTVNATGGTETHTLTVAEMPYHAHGQVVTNPGAGGSGVRSDYNSDGAAYTYDQGVTTGFTGSSNAHNNLQPYKVKYMWERTA